MRFSEIADKIKKSWVDNDANVTEIGRVISFADGIAKVYGLSQVFYYEIVKINGFTGMVMELSIDYVSVVMLEANAKVESGQEAVRTKKFLEAPCGMSILGRVLDGIGRPLDGSGDLNASEFNPTETDAPPIMARRSIHEPMFTGTLAIDSAIPIGRGQRELIIGDRGTGKSTIAINAMLNQSFLHKSDGEQLVSDKEAIFCVYVMIGKQQSLVAELVQKLRESGAINYSIVVSASAYGSSAEKYIAPYLGCTIAEWFRDNGKHALIIYDDLTKHAAAYREISLLLRRPPGREAYPGDIFYIHSKLLERAAKLDDKHGSGSLTALPIVETQQGDISAYIPTNVISITDGQIYMDSNLLKGGILPAIDLPLSVSRVSSSAQFKLIKELSKGIKLDMSVYKSTLANSKLSSDIDDHSQKALNKGELLNLLFGQSSNEILRPYEEIVYLYIYRSLSGSNRSITKSALLKIKDEISTMQEEIMNEKNNKELSKELSEKLDEIIGQ